MSTARGPLSDRPPAGEQAAGDRVEEYQVIVHGTGRLEDRAAAAFWTEVPALAACMAEGPAVDEALANTRQAIAAWLLRTRGSVPELRLTTDLAF